MSIFANEIDDGWYDQHSGGETEYERGVRVAKGYWEPQVTAMQQEIAELNVRNAELEKVAETASEILRLCAKNFERSTLWADWQNLDDALRSAGYLGGGDE